MNMNKQISNILFVCIGNICRSPFAQGLFTKLVRQEGHKGFYAESAGLLALPGNSATFLAQKVAADHGVDDSIKQFTDLAGSDMVLAAETGRQLTGPLADRHHRRHGVRPALEHVRLP